MSQQQENIIFPDAQGPLPEPSYFVAGAASAGASLLGGLFGWIGKRKQRAHEKDLLDQQISGQIDIIESTAEAQEDLLELQAEAQEQLLKQALPLILVIVVAIITILTLRFLLK